MSSGVGSLAIDKNAMLSAVFLCSGGSRKLLGEKVPQDFVGEAGVPGLPCSFTAL